MKTVCAVFALDAVSGDQVAIMRRQLLRLVHCREFGTAAIFQVCVPAPGMWRYHLWTSREIRGAALGVE